MFKSPKGCTSLLWLCLLGVASGVSAQDLTPKAKGVNDALPRPDGKPADVSKTVKVFILMGQSNMLEMGQVAGDKDLHSPELVGSFCEFWGARTFSVRHAVCRFLFSGLSDWQRQLVSSPMRRRAATCERSGLP